VDLPLIPRPLTELSVAELEELVARLRAAIEACQDRRAVAPSRERERIWQEILRHGRALGAAKFEIWRRS
jgi:hypothetical protein